MQKYRSGDEFENIQTKLRILKAVDKPIDEISVNEICINAGVSRQTFYNHFGSKNSLLPWWSKWCEQFYLDFIGRKYSWEEGYLRHVIMFHSGASFLEKALNKGFTPPYWGGYETSLRRKNVIIATLKGYKNREVDNDLLYCIDVFAHLESELTVEAYKKRQNGDVVMRVKRIVSVIPPLLYQSLQTEEFSTRSQIENFYLIDDLATSILLNSQITLNFFEQE